MDFLIQASFCAPTMHFSLAAQHYAGSFLAVFDPDEYFFMQLIQGLNAHPCSQRPLDLSRNPKCFILSALTPLNSLRRLSLSSSSGLFVVGGVATCMGDWAYFVVRW